MKRWRISEEGTSSTHEEEGKKGNDSDVYFLDDPFSVVDAHTAAILFYSYVIAALAHKIVSLVTHQVEFLFEIDKILVAEAG